MLLRSRAGSPAYTLCHSLLTAVLIAWTTAEAAPVGSPWRRPRAAELKAAMAAILSWSHGACRLYGALHSLWPSASRTAAVASGA